MPTSTTWPPFKRHRIPTARSSFHICPGSASSYSVGRQQKLKRRFVTSSYISHCVGLFFIPLPIDDKVWRDSFAHAENWFNTWRICYGFVIYFELRHRKPNFSVEPFLVSTLMKMHLKKKKKGLPLQNTLQSIERWVQREWLQIWCISGAALQPMIQYGALPWYLYLGHRFELCVIPLSLSPLPRLHTLARTPCEHATNAKHAYASTCIGLMPRGTKLPLEPWLISR